MSSEFFYHDTGIFPIIQLSSKFMISLKAMVACDLFEVGLY